MSKVQRVTDLTEKEHEKTIIPESWFRRRDARFEAERRTEDSSGFRHHDRILPRNPVAYPYRDGSLERHSQEEIDGLKG